MLNDMAAAGKFDGSLRANDENMRKFEKIPEVRGNFSV